MKLIRLLYVNYSELYEFVGLFMIAPNCGTKCSRRRGAMIAIEMFVGFRCALINVAWTDEFVWNVV